MKFIHFLIALLPTSYVACREASEFASDISRLDSPQDVAKYVLVNRQELESKLPMMDDNTRRKVEDSLRSSNSSTSSTSGTSGTPRNSTSTTPDDSGLSASTAHNDDSIMTFYMLFVIIANFMMVNL